MASLLGQAAPSGGWSDATGSSDATEYILATGIECLVAGTITGIWYFVPTVQLPTNASFATGLITVPSGVFTGTTISVSEAETKPVSGDLGTWKFYSFTTPQSAASGAKVLACVRTDRYALKNNLFTSSALTNGAGNLRAWQDATNFPNGAFRDSGLGTLIGAVPQASFGEAFYGIDLEFTPDAGATSVPPRSRARNVGALLQV